MKPRDVCVAKRREVRNEAKRTRRCGVMEEDVRPRRLLGSGSDEAMGKLVLCRHCCWLADDRAGARPTCSTLSTERDVRSFRCAQE